MRSEDRYMYKHIMKAFLKSCTLLTYLFRCCNINFFAVMIPIISCFLLKFNTGLPQILSALGGDYTAVFSVVGSEYTIESKWVPTLLSRTAFVRKITFLVLMLSKI